MNEKKQNGSGKRRVWRGLTTLLAALLAFVLAASPVVAANRTDIDKFLGTQSTKIETDTSTGENPYTYQSDYKSTTELLDAIEDLGERMNEEGSVLLKNNGALPLTQEETQKVTLLGFSSYYPVQGGDMGSSLAVNTGTDADTVDLVQAFTAKGYGLNPTMETVYKGLEDTFKTEVESWGGTQTYHRQTAPATDGVFTSHEPSQAALSGADADWKDSMDDYNVMIVTIARAAGENRNYMPGEAGVDPAQNLNQTDPLGLSDDERDIISAAVEAKAQNGGKVVVLLNNASAMEIDEIKRNDGVDAILEIGLPGGYGFYGVADILSGAANPSGRLADTYAVVNANSPAAQNYGNFPYTNANQELYINSALVEAESIYAGYKYYETRYADVVLGQGNAADAAGSSTGGAWSYDSEVSYPFGYGLSYTTFTQTLDSLNVDLEAGTVTAQVTVTNTGAAAGKDVVQLYVSVPYTDYDKQNGIEKAAIQLLDYEKTGVLEPGASQTVTITADAQYMASWDSGSDNAAGTKGCYILDAGDYRFSIGNAHEAVNNILAAQGKTAADGMTAEGNAANVKTWNLGALDNTTFARTKNGTAVENQLQDADLNHYMPGTVTYLSRSDWAGTWPKTYRDLTANEAMLAQLDNDTYEITAQGDPSSVTFGAQNDLTLADLKGVSDLSDIRWSTLMDQITLEECMIRTGFGGTSTKVIESIVSPETIQNDGPNGINSYTLGQYANTDASSGDPCAVDESDPNLTYKFGTMSNETVIAQTFSKEMAAEYGRVIGNYSLWSNLTIFWGAGTNLHRVPYNARNHEYYSEDPILSAYQGAAYIAAGMEYGCIIAPKHFAYNDTEINRSGISVFFTEQQARENELRGTQACIEDANALGVMTAFNRIGVTAGNAHYGLLMNILRGEWGFKGLMSEDFITNSVYSVLKEAVHAGVTMTCNTGDSTMAAVSEKWSYWTVENVSKDAGLMQDLKNVMTWQNYAIANSNAMDGLSSSSRVVSVRTWYDNALTAAQIVLAVLTLGAAVMYVKSAKGKDEA
ncbi:beta-glucosidase [Pseudoflavonifractor phocaeensis]|uniref:beta-glucosidase n=1 Tax=Pseudoflavonifractor phocaeensis TaxID=1870988 RepID=UPI002109BFFF|nr:glycoside hydrolase family 3 C-terminal domain-containing protein [Pseudoflavonifractor phocaeensis]MCQ4863305.1 glycoside hydrolase family 3 C-terminal domain-containing protein [Pseudoflavonifractor phocaeensis]